MDSDYYAEEFRKLQQEPNQGKQLQIPERVLNAVEKTETCWVWTKGKLAGGYGQVVVDKQKWTAHRLFYSVYKGPIPEGKLICHTCDNPSCVNPEHLYCGTHTENNRDTYTRDRMPIRHGDAAINVVKLSREAALEIKYSALTSKELAQKHQIHQSQVSRIRNGHTWKNI